MRTITSLEGVPMPKITTISRQKCESTCLPVDLSFLEHWNHADIVQEMYASILFLGGTEHHQSKCDLPPE
jgi:hypothetical protein